MTNGTSQGLYVIVAVVIFGIFVGISYLLFQSSLNPKLMAIFKDSLDESETNLNNGWKDLRKHIVLSRSPLKKGSSYEYEINSLEYQPPVNYDVVYTLMNVDKKLYIPYNHKYEIRFKVLSEKDIIISADYNTEIEKRTEENAHIVNDFYTYAYKGENKGSASFFRKTVPANKEVEIILSYTTEKHVANPHGYGMYDFTQFGILQSDVNVPNNFKIVLSDVKYKITEL